MVGPALCRRDWAGGTIPSRHEQYRARSGAEALSIVDRRRSRHDRAACEMTLSVTRVRTKVEMRTGGVFEYGPRRPVCRARERRGAGALCEAEANGAV